MDEHEALLIDEEYAARPHGNSKLIWFVAISIIILLLLFGILIAWFFTAANTGPLHDINVINNCTGDVQLIFGNTDQRVSAGIIKSGESKLIRASPGSDVSLFGLIDSNSTILTETVISLAGDGYAGNHIITDGAKTLDSTLVNFNPIDIYSVSVVNGENVPMTVSAKSGSTSCTGPNWHYNISNTGDHVCPAVLQRGTTGSDGTGGTIEIYQACVPPCSGLCPAPDGGFTFGCTNFCCNNPNACSQTGGCQSSWNFPEAYEIFAGACPQCLITNCDTPNFTCKSQNHKTLTAYEVIFCPAFV